MSFCQGCIEKQPKIDQLSAEKQRLKSQRRYRQRKQPEGFFGSSTPSAKQPVKANSEAEKQASCGGAQKGHPGHGRKSIDPQNAARTLAVPLDQHCHQCGGALQDKGWRQRSVLE